MAENKFASLNRIWPQYKYDERLKIDIETEAPDSSLFMEIGHNKTSADKVKHYRRYFRDELEKIDDVMPGCPFINEGIHRMVQKDAGLFGFGGSDDS